MALKKRGEYYYSRFKFRGKEIYRSTGTSVRAKAQEFEDSLKKQLWDSFYLNKKPSQYWITAVNRYTEEATKKTLYDDMLIIRWLNKYLEGKSLQEIDRDYIEYV